MNDNELLEHYRQLSPVQLASKRAILLKHISLFRKLKDESNDNLPAISAYNALATDCIRRYSLVGRVLREGAGE